MDTDSAQVNTALSFDGTNFFFPGLSLPYHRILNFLLNTYELFHYGPTFYVSFLMDYIVKKFKTILNCLSGAQMGWINDIKKC